MGPGKEAEGVEERSKYPKSNMTGRGDVLTASIPRSMMPSARRMPSSSAKERSML